MGLIEARSPPSSLLDKRAQQLPIKWCSRCELAAQHTNEASCTRDCNTLADLADYEWLTETTAATLLADLAHSDEPVHRMLTRLRKTLSTQRAGLVVQQLALRHRAAAKFGELAERMFFTDVGLQQATDLWIAKYKASRLARGREVVDYCSGIGGDLLGFAAHGPAVGWDSAPEIATLANANLSVAGYGATSRVEVGRVESHQPSLNDVWHLDPDRRRDGQRSTQLQWHSPEPDVIDLWLASNPTGAIKLAPATTVPEDWAQRAECEWISRNRECRQQMVWFGDLAKSPGLRRATSIGSATAIGTPHTFTGAHDIKAPLTDTVARYIYDTDPAVRAAGLTGAIAREFGLEAFNDGASYLTSESPADHGLLARLEVRDVLPLRLDVLTRHLRSLRIGDLEIKKRGVATSPERLRKQLKLQGDQRATLLLTRVGTSEIAVLADRDEG